MQRLPTVKRMENITATFRHRSVLPSGEGRKKQRNKSRFMHSPSISEKVSYQCWFTFQNIECQRSFISAVSVGLLRTHFSLMHNFRAQGSEASRKVSKLHPDSSVRSNLRSNNHVLFPGYFHFKSSVTDRFVFIYCPFHCHLDHVECRSDFCRANKNTYGSIKGLSNAAVRHHMAAHVVSRIV